MKERLDKLLSHGGFGSRQDVHDLLHTRTVTLNGTVVTDASFKIDPDTDMIEIEGKPFRAQKNMYIMMNKPQETVSANKDGIHTTVFQLLDDRYHTPFLEEHLHIIGRLDLDTEGLLVFTTDGELTHAVTSPKNHHSKTYLVRLRDSADRETQASYVKQCASGVHIPPEANEAEADCLPADLVFHFADQNTSCECELTIYEGKFHEVKRIFAVLGNEVVYLKRLSIGRLRLDPSLEPGSYREMTDDEALLLKQ